MRLVTLPVAALEVCDRTRVRAQKPRANSEIVAEYAEAYECGLITEPLDVFRENGTERYIVADGEHRLLALQRAKIAKVECRLHEGDEIAALDFAIGCNQAHGLRRTERDRYHAFVRMMETSLRSKYRTDTDISDKLGVSIRTVKRYRAQWRDSEGGDTAQKEQARATAEKHNPQKAGNMTRVMSRVSSDTSSVKGAVMNPPESAAQGSEAGNRATPVGVGPGRVRPPVPALGSDTSSLSAPTGGESETEPAGSDSRHGRQPPRVSVDGSQEQWTDRDEKAYRAIRQAWDAATTAARVRFMAEERRGV